MSKFFRCPHKTEDSDLNLNGLATFLFGGADRFLVKSGHYLGFYHGKALEISRNDCVGHMINFLHIDDSLYDSLRKDLIRFYTPFNLYPDCDTKSFFSMMLEDLN